MNVTYFKRFRMEIDLYAAPPAPPLADGYFWVAWDDALLEAHAEVKFHSFHEEIDASVFSSLGDRQGCLNLMHEIRRKPGFLPGATWLVANAAGYWGTVQGVCDPAGLGAIQNLGVVPSLRGRGLGTALLLRALEGFRGAGLGRAYLEVTAQNDLAIQLYRRLGFRCRKTLYKAVDGGRTVAVGQP
jgi:ribosomal protein S18 acetylase RimI-like enzyme